MKALELHWSISINWILIIFSAKIVFLNTFSQHSSVPSAQSRYSDVWSFRASFLNDSDSSFFSDKFWSFFSDACSEAFVQTFSMRRFHRLELSSKLLRCDRFLIYWKMWVTVIVATDFLIEVIFRARSCIDAKSAETNESIFDNATRFDEEQSRFVWRMHRCLQSFDVLNELLVRCCIDMTTDI